MKMVLNEVFKDDLVEGQDYLLFHEELEIVFGIWNGDCWVFEDKPTENMDWATKVFESPRMDRVVSE